MGDGDNGRKTYITGYKIDYDELQAAIDSLRAAGADLNSAGFHLQSAIVKVQKSTKTKAKKQK